MAINTHMYFITSSHSRKGRATKWLFIVAFLALTLCVAGNLRAQGSDIGAGSGLTPEQEKELAYADALLNAGMPDYASIVLDKIKIPPEMMAIRQIRSLTARGEFEEAQKIVDDNAGTSQSAMTLKLTLADGYYAWGKYDQAQELYESFFKAFPDGPEEAIKSFYMSSAYKYAQMMLLTGNRKAASEAYKMALKADPQRHVKRQLQSELAELLMVMATNATGERQEELMKQVKALADEILWVQDLWFGRAIVLLAHMRVLRGDIEGAMALVEDYTPNLRGIDKALREQSTPEEDLTKLSPMAQCRYLIGEIMHDRAIEIIEAGGNKDQALSLLIGSGGRDGAVQHFLNVFIRYPNTTWAPNAGKRFREVESLLKEEFGRAIKVNTTPEQWRAVELAQFREAKTLFNQARYAEASKAYLDVLTLFPEKSTSVPALGELAACFIEEEEFILADTVARHIAERFHANEELSTDAGNQVIRIAAKFTSVNQPLRYRDTYEVFFTYFTEHPRVLLDLQRFAREAMDAEDYENAERYLTLIVKNHEGKKAYYTALSNLVKIYEVREDTDKQARALIHLIKELQKANMKSHLLISANYRLANIMRGMGDRGIEQAQQRYKYIQKILNSKEADEYAKNEQEAEANEKLLQAAIFYEAVTDAMRKKVPKKIYEAFVKRAGGKKVPESLILDKYYKANAIKKLNQLVEAYPDSPFAPAALSQIGTLNTILGDAAAASKALERLQKEYPDTAEAKNAIYMIGRNLLEMGRRDEAVEYFKQMFSGTTQYPAGQIFGAAEELLAAEEYEIALQAYNRVLDTTEDRRLIEPSKVGKGEALLELDQFQEASEWMDKVLEEYPKSGLLVRICRTASAANAGLASTEQDAAKRQELFTKSIELMNRARRIAQDEAVGIELDIAAARLAERKAEAEEQFGTKEQADAFRNEAVAAYQTVMMFRDASNPKLAPHIQTAYGQCVPLMAELGRWSDVMQDATTYLENFPNGRYVNEMRKAQTDARIQGDG